VLVERPVLARKDGELISRIGNASGITYAYYSSVTLVGEADRKMLKAAIKRSGGEDKVRHRVITVEAIAQWKETLDDLKDEVQAVLKEEKEEKVVSFSLHLRPILALIPQIRCVKLKWN